MEAPSPDADLTIRLSAPDEGDSGSIRRLASVGGKTPPEGPVMVAEVDGQPVAALGLADGNMVRDPLLSSTAVIAVLHLHRLEARLIGSVFGG